MRQTSIAALETVPIGARQQQVLDALRELGAATDKEIANHTGLPINCITGRRGELVAMGKVVERGEVIQNGRRAITWSLASRAPSKSGAAPTQGALL